MNARDKDENGCLSFEEFLQAMPANIINITEDEHRYELVCTVNHLHFFYITFDVGNTSSRFNRNSEANASK